MKSNRAIAALLSVVLLLAATSAACADSAAPEEQQDSPAEASRPAELVFTYTDIAGLEELQRSFGEFQSVLSDVLELDVELMPVSDRLAAVEALAAGQVDVVLTGASEYVAIKALEPDAVPLVGIERPNNRTQIRTHPGSGITTLDDLRGREIDVIAPGSTSGHLGASMLLQESGIDPQTDVEFVFLGPTAGIIALAQQELPAQALSEAAFTAAVQRARDSGTNVDLTNLPVVAEGPILPPDAFIASGTLPEPFREELRAKLLMAEDQLLSVLQQAGAAGAAYTDDGTRFVEIDDDDFDYMRDAWRAIGQEDLGEIPE